MAHPIKTVTPPPPPGKPGGLGEKIEITVQRAVAFVLDLVGEVLRDILTAGLELFLEVLEPALIAMYSPLLRMVADRPETPSELKTAINEALSGEHPAGAAVLAALGSSAGSAVIGSVLSSLLAPVTYAVNRKILPARMDPAAAVASFYRPLFGEPETDERLADLGWSPAQIAAWKEVLRPRLSIGELFTEAYRSGKDLAAVRAEMRRRGYGPDDTFAAEELAKLMPGPGDLISMAVREAFDPAIVAKYGYDQNFPEVFGEWMRKQGDTEDWARKYWAAHWRMPGLVQALDAYYRLDDFGDAELDEFLRVADIAPAWRDYIKRTAYRMLTRVDIRRMYRVGVLDRAGLLRQYKNYGYSPTDAELMTDFTIQYETEEDREATKSDILSFLTVGSLDAGEAATWLMQIGYPENLAVYLVARELTKIERARADQQIKYIKNLYVHGEISTSQASSQLAAVGLSAGEIQAKLAEWNIDREAKIRRPSQATLDKFFKSDVISQAEYVSGLENLGFQADYVSWYLDSILLEKSELARREEEKARAEQESIRVRKIKSNYQVAKASLDVDIAEVTTAISETQLALRERYIRYQQELRVAREALTTAELEELAAKDIAALEASVANQREAIAFLREQIEVLETEMVEIRVKATPQPKTLSPGEAAMATREREVTIEEQRVGIEALQTEIAAIKLAATPVPPDISPEEVNILLPGRALAVEAFGELTEEEADILTRERQLAIEVAQDTIAALESEIATIRLERLVVVVELTPEEEEKQLQEHRLAIELAQDDIESASMEIVKLQEQIRQRRLQLQEELRLAEVVAAVEDVETAWLADQATMTAQLTELRLNLAALREQKAQLAVGYREGLAA